MPLALRVPQWLLLRWREKGISGGASEIAATALTATSVLG
jgi:hypothetical protein